MTVVFVGKGLVLGGWPIKIEVMGVLGKHILGIYILSFALKIQGKLTNDSGSITRWIFFGSSPSAQGMGMDVVSKTASFFGLLLRKPQNNRLFGQIIAISAEVTPNWWFGKGILHKMPLISGLGIIVICLELHIIIYIIQLLSQLEIPETLVLFPHHSLNPKFVPLVS